MKVVSERLGHANVAFTMSIYQHVLPGMQAEAADTFFRLIGDGHGLAGREPTTEDADADADGDGDDSDAQTDGADQ